MTNHRLPPDFIGANTHFVDDDVEVDGVMDLDDVELLPLDDVPSAVEEAPQRRLEPLSPEEFCGWG